MKLSPIVDHGYLLGLGDDDHPQYLHLNKVAQTLQQNLAVTGGVTIDGVDISAHAGNVNAHIDNLTDIPTRNHNDLLNIGVSDHHARYTNAEAVAAVQANGLSLSGNLVLTTTNPYIRWYDTDGALNEKDARMYWYEGGLLFRSHNDNGSTKLNLLTIAHNGNIGVAAAATVDGVDISAHAADVNAHHAQAHTLASHSTKAHSELTGVTASQHHTKYTNAEAAAAAEAKDPFSHIGNVIIGEKIYSILNASKAPGGGYIKGGGMNLMTNASATFELGTTGWVPRSGLSLSSSSEQAYSGTRSLKPFSDSEPTQFEFGVYYGTVLQDDEQDDFVAVAWVFLPTAGGLTSVYLQYRDGGANFYSGGITYNSFRITTKDSWQKIVLPFSAKATSGSGFLWFWAGGGGIGHYMYVDNVQVQRGTIPTEFSSLTCDPLGNLALRDGNFLLSPAATVDGVDISAHAANADAHHAQAHTLASHSTKAHSELTGVTANLHHAQAHKLDSHTDPDGILTTKGTLLKTGTQTEGRCHVAITAQGINHGAQVTVCFREELTNVPSSITLSDVGTTQDVNLADGYPQVMRISKFGFGFMIRAAAAGDALSGDKKFLTVGN